MLAGTLQVSRQVQPVSSVARAHEARVTKLVMDILIPVAIVLRFYFRSIFGKPRIAVPKLECHLVEIPPNFSNHLNGALHSTALLRRMQRHFTFFMLVRKSYAAVQHEIKICCHTVYI